MEARKVAGSATWYQRENRMTLCCSSARDGVGVHLLTPGWRATCAAAGDMLILSVSRHPIVINMS